MLDIGIPELLVIFVVILLVFGPGKLPEVGRGFGRAIGEFRRMTSGVGLLDALEKQPPSTLRPTEVRCPTCSTLNPASNRFCGTCGQTLASETVPSRQS